MRYLLDTHTFLWFLLNNDSLSKTVRDIIEDSPTLYLSIVSLWEIAIKTSIHKLNLIIVDSINETTVMKHIRLLL